MKSKSMGYLTKEGFRNLRVNKLMSFASVTVLFSCLLMIGIAFLLLVNIESLISGIEEQNVIMVYVEDGTEPADVKAVQSKIEGLSNIGTCTFVSKEEAYQQVVEELDSVKSYLEGLENPLPDSFKVTVKDMSQFGATVKTLSEMDNVIKVRENSELAKQLANARNSVTYISIGVIAMLFLVSLFIISNTIRLTMFSRRLEISIMKSVGATNAFIRWPFMIEGILLGIIAGVLSFFTTWGVYAIVMRSFSSMLTTFGVSAGVPFAQYAHFLLGGFVGIGVFAGIFGSITSIRKYLKERKFVDIEDV